MEQVTSHAEAIGGFFLFLAWSGFLVWRTLVWSQKPESVAKAKAKLLALRIKFAAEKIDAEVYLRDLRHQVEWEVKDAARTALDAVDKAIADVKGAIKR